MRTQREMENFFLHLNDEIIPDLCNRKNKILRIARRNKIFLALLVVPMAIKGTLFVIGKIHSFEELLLIFFSILIIAYIFYFTTSSISLVPTTILTNHTSHYKNEVIRNAIRFIDEDIEYSIFHNTADNYFNLSSFFHRKITDKNEDDGICGNKNGISYYISEVKIQEFLQFTFKGLFIVSILDEETDTNYILLPKDDKRKIKSAMFHHYVRNESFSDEKYILFSKGGKINLTEIDKNVKLLKQYSQDTGNNIALSNVSHYLFLTVDLKEESYFEILYKTDKEMITKAKDDIMLLYATLNLTESIISRYSNL